MRLILPLCLVAAVAFGETSRELDAPVEAFLRTLREDSIAPLAALGQVSMYGARRNTHIRDFVDRYECISVHHVSWSVESRSEDRARVRVNMAAGAVTFGVKRTPTHLPRAWILNLVRVSGAWQIETAIPLERDVALQLVRVGTEAEWREILARHKDDVDLRLVTRYVAWNFWEHLENGKQTFAWMHEISRNVDPVAEFECLRMAAKLAMFGTKGEGPRKGKELVAFAEKLGDPDVLAQAWMMLAMTHWFAGERVEAAEAYRRVTTYLALVDDPRPSLHALYMRAWMHRDLAQAHEALRAVADLRVLAREYGWPEGETGAAIMQGGVYEELRNLDLAVAAHTTAYENAKRSFDTELTEVSLENLATSLMDTDPKRSRELLLELRATAREVLAVVVNEKLGMVYAGEGDLGRAEQFFTRAVNMACQAEESRTYASSHERLGRVALAQERFEDALRHAELATPALKLPSASAWVTDLVDPRLYALQARALRGLGRRDEARAAAQAGVDWVESRRGQFSVDHLSVSRYLADKAEPYHQLVEILVEENRPFDALIVAEQLKARTMSEVLTRARVTFPQQGERGAEEERKLNERIVQLNTEWLGATPDSAERKAIEARLESARFDLRRFQTEQEVGRRVRDSTGVTFDAPSVAAMLPSDGDAIVELSVHETSVYAFVITRAGVAVRRISIEPRELEPAIDGLVKAIERRDLRAHAQARVLYDRLLRPIEPLLAGRRRICIIPDGVLWRLPFQALRDAKGRYLVETAAVFYAPSLTVLRVIGKPGDAARPHTLLAFGNPVVPQSQAAAVRAFYRGITLGPLPDAETEVRAIAAAYGRGNSRVLVGAEASEALAKAAADEFRILHFATHGIIDEASPMFSALLLTPTEGEDGLLEGREIVRLQLNADLAVLSACQTARGRVDSGEGVVGLSWALMIAGCPTTVVSQWDVASPSTARLMTAFHRALARGAGKAEAMRQAQLEMMRGGDDHPFYWAPFVVVGGGW